MSAVGVLLSIFLNLIIVACFFTQLKSIKEEGDDCKLETGQGGVCKKITECPSKYEEAQKGIRLPTSSRCGFDKLVEIVCCPDEINVDIRMRPADLACEKWIFDVYPSVTTFGPTIVGGTPAKAAEFPFLVALGYENRSNKNRKKRYKYSCGGTLISSTYVLTAAHCVNNINNNFPVVARMGSIDLNAVSNKVQEIPIVNIIPHPDYKRSEVYNDIALLKLSKPVKWTSDVIPICLQAEPIDSNNPPEKYEFVVAGWGATDDDAASNILLKSGNLKLIPQRECSLSYAGFRQVPRGLDQSVICAIDRNITRKSDACQGDSGGPLMMLRPFRRDDNRLLAVVSFGQSCGSPIAAVYTSVAAYVSWIEKHVWPERQKIE